MSQSSRDIEREVEASRANVEETVEALKDKMSVGQIVDEAARYLGNNGGTQMFANLGTQVRENPLPLALVGVGIIWLMSGRGTPHLSLGHSHSAPDYRRPYRSPAEFDDRGMRSEGSVYEGASHPDYAARTMGSGESWGDNQYRSYDRGSSYDQGSSGDSEGLLDRVGRAAHDVRDAVSGAVGAVGTVAGAVGGAASTVASGIGSAAGTVASGARAAASGAARLGSGLSSAGGSLAHGARSMSSGAWQGGSEAYDEAYRMGGGAYDAASRAGYGAYDSASRMGYQARRTFSDVLEREPLVIGALGLAVGAAIGAMLPGTDVEDRYMGETRDSLRDNAEAFAREQFERGKAVAEEAYRTAKSEAEAAGLTHLDTGNLVDKVGDVARATLDRVREAAAEQGLPLASTGQSSSDQDTVSDATTASDMNRQATDWTAGRNSSV